VPTIVRSRVSAVAGVLVAVALVAAGCGGSTSTTTGTSGARDAAAMDNGVAKRPALEILQASASALRGVTSLHVEGHEHMRSHVYKAGRDITVQADVSTDGSSRVHERIGRSDVRIVVVGGQAYIKGNDEFWTTTGGIPPIKRVLDAMRGHWIELPPKAVPSARKTTSQLQPKRLAHCMTEELGKLSVRGVRTVRGQKAVIVRSRSWEHDGTAPGDVAIAVEGLALPVRVRRTGPGDAADGPSDDPACREPVGAHIDRSELYFSRYDAPLHIVKPPGALDMATLMASLGPTV
jgi:hypothetical protein